MSWFNNLRLAPKLLASFAVVALIATACGAGVALRWQPAAGTPQSDGLPLSVFVLLLVLAVLLEVTIAVYTTKTVSGPVGAALTRLREIAGGATESVIDTHRQDEVGLLLAGLSDIQGNLRTLRDREAEDVAATAWMKGALDKASARLMVVNAANEITYVNEAAQTMFRQRQAEMRAKVPTFDAERLIGARLDALYQSSAGAASAED
jgi:methyl-accepting chemotaxis protein